MVTRLMVSLAAAFAVISAASLDSQAAAGSCGSSGHVLVQRSGVVVWTTHAPDRNGNEGSVFMCASPSGRSVLLQRNEQQVSNATVTQLTHAGNFVGFFLRTNVEVASKFLIVFDRLHGRLELRDLAECDYNDECTGPSMTGYRVAPDGWVAEVWPSVVSNGAGLLATNGSTHYQLDVTPISHLRLLNGTLTWTSSAFGSASIRLGPQVITPASPRKLSACRLLTAAELAPALGPDSTASSQGATCTYTSTADPGRRLTLQFRTGLTRSQMAANERALTNAPSYCTLGQWWPADDNFYDLEVAHSAVCGYGGKDVRFVIFANGAEVSLHLTSPGVWLVAHLSNVAVDRLFGVPIKRTS